MTLGYGAADASYHQRHMRRSKRRAKCIAANISGPADVLDVGCNVGITSQHLLESGVACGVTGIELSADTVADKLKQDPRFTLIEGNIAKVDPGGPYDVVIYGAVHHHVLNHHGLSAATAVLRKLANCCRSSLFFETGQLGEGGRWDWQRTMRRYFKTDEEHFYFLMSCIEDLVSDIEIIGRFWMHGIRRAYIRCDLKPLDKRSLPDVPGDVVRLRSAPTHALGRTFGSARQKLAPLGSKDVIDSPTWFAVADGLQGETYFLKRHMLAPVANVREATINAQINHNWAVKQSGKLDDGITLVFPLVRDFLTIDELACATEENRLQAAEALLEVFELAATTPIRPPALWLLPGRRGRTLLDVCDINPNNVLFLRSAASITARIVDFEQQSLRYRWKNRINLGRMLVTLRSHRLRAVAEIAIGIADALRLALVFQMAPLKRRILCRQPALLSRLVTELRTITGSALGRVLRVFILK